MKPDDLPPSSPVVCPRDRATALSAPPMTSAPPPSPDESHNVGARRGVSAPQSGAPFWLRASAVVRASRQNAACACILAEACLIGWPDQHSRWQLYGQKNFKPSRSRMAPHDSGGVLNLL